MENDKGETTGGGDGGAGAAEDENIEKDGVLTYEFEEDLSTYTYWVHLNRDRFEKEGDGGSLTFMIYRNITVGFCILALQIYYEFLLLAQWRETECRVHKYLDKYGEDRNYDQMMQAIKAASAKNEISAAD